MSEKLIIEAKVPEKKNADGTIERKQLGPVQISVETGATAAESIALFGDKAVKSNADANWTVTIQGNIRARLAKGETAEQIQAGLGTAKMGVAVKGAKVDPVQAYMAIFASSTPERQKELLKELAAKAAK